MIFCIRGWYVLFSGTIFIPLPISSQNESAILTSDIYLAVSLIIFYIALNVRFKFQKRSAVRELSDERILLFTPIFLFIGVSANALLINVSGGLDFYLNNKQETLTQGGVSYILQFSSILQYLYLIHVARYFSMGSGKIITFLFLLPIIIIIGIASGSKGLFLYPILATLILYNFLVKSVSIKYLGIFGLIVILIIPLFNIYRGVSNIFDIQDSFEFMLDSGSASENMNLFIFGLLDRFHDFDSFVYIVRDTPNLYPFQFGSTFITILIAWIPRFLWLDKPTISFGKIFSETYYSDFYFGTGTSASPTMIGEGYINFHIAGVIFISIIMGAILNYMYRSLIKAEIKQPINVLIYSIFFVPMIIMWETNISGFFSEMLFKILIVVSMINLVSKR